MEYLLSKNVEYVCECGLLKPLTNLYFCRHCLNLRCFFCCHHEVDSHFCRNCLENIPSGEAKLRKNKCNTCFDCPSCTLSALSARATTIQVPMTKEVKEGGEGSEIEASSGKMVSKKMYYLACLACRFSSRDVGISDQPSQNFFWPEQEYMHAIRFNTILNHYYSVVLHDKQLKQEERRRRSTKQSKFPNMTDRTGLNVSAIRRQMGFDKSAAKPKSKPTAIAPSIAEDVDDLPEEIFTQPINLKNITTIQQRFTQPANQPESVKHLYPQHKNLSIKRSIRCRHCEHNVIKPEYNPTSIKYRIQQFASSHVPEVRIIKCDQLVPNKSALITLKITNPTMNDMIITIMDLPTEEEEKMMIEEMRKNFEKNLSVSNKSSLMRPSLIEDSRIVSCKITAKLELPDSSFVINQRDDSAEFDDDVQSDKKDPKFILWRKANKIAIQLSITPNGELKVNDDVKIGFSMNFTYSSVPSSTPEKKETQRYALCARIYINAGKIVQ
ncbi:hypothetical protein PVAND_003383 [Polypedilum vanderplanki]|uniref:Dynactin subunit 4 n=1 Tax=Polypedilum vanderplanki TaxID=319348 RepID=A0A9J6BUY2_POLVA|nr:hypothetical protein PVAND_003383 [Polypedilum vanderplanki]